MADHKYLVSDPAHVARVEAVSRAVQGRGQKRLTIKKATNSHTVRDTDYKKDCHAVDVSKLTHVLDVDVERSVVRVEGQVCMKDLVPATLKKGYVPAVVPEFASFTVSGLINGEGIQSSCHRHGIFSATVRKAEIVLGDGRVVTASKESDPDLFRLVFSSHGTLGIVTSAEIQLVKAEPYVQSTYLGFRDLDEYLKAFAASLGKHAFVEGVVFAKDHHVLITSDFVAGPGRLAVYDPFETGAPYYYQHVRALTEVRGRPVSDALTTEGYTFRSMRGLWWMTECHVGLPAITNSALGRKLVDGAVDKALATYGFQAPGLNTEERERCLVNQDMGLKLSRLGDGIRFVQRELDIYPLWNCAVRVPDEARELVGEDYIVDLGIYGEPMVPDYRNGQKMRALQRFCDYPSFWGVSYLSREEIREAGVYDYEAYERVRKEYAAEGAFLHLDEKTVWFEQKGDEPGKIPLWRLYRSYGPRWYLKLPFIIATLGLGDAMLDQFRQRRAR